MLAHGIKVPFHLLGQNTLRLPQVVSSCSQQYHGGKVGVTDWSNLPFMKCSTKSLTSHWQLTQESKVLFTSGQWQTCWPHLQKKITIVGKASQSNILSCGLANAVWALRTIMLVAWAVSSKGVVHEQPPQVVVSIMLQPGSTNFVNLGISGADSQASRSMSITLYSELSPGTAG